MEEWRDIVGFEGLYSVSNSGVVRSIRRVVPRKDVGNGTYRTVSERVLKTHLTKDGYERVCLYKNGVSSMHLIHKLVLSSFNGFDPSRNCIDHINGIRTDNRIDNLRWVTVQENQMNPITRRRLSIAKKGENHHYYGKKFTKEHAAKIGEANKNGKCSKPVVGISKDGKIVEFPSMAEACRSIGVSHGNIWRSCMCIYRTAGGYRWHYKNKHNQS